MRIKLVFIFIIFFSGISVPQVPGHWITRTPMPTPRQEIPHALINGKIYVPGGIVNNSGIPTNSVEVYDPSTDSWSEISPMPEALHHHTAVELNGKLYIIGGYNAQLFSSQTDKVQEYDPQTGIWTEKQSLPYPIASHTSAALDGMIYLFGGRNGNTLLNNSLVYDPQTNNWNVLTNMPYLSEHLACAVLDTFVCVFAGRNFTQNFKKFFIYYPMQDEWIEMPDMPTARSGLAAATLNGRVYVFGGEIPGVYEENEEFNFITNQWRQVRSMPTPRHGIGAVTVGDTIYIIGGARVQGFDQSNVNEGYVNSFITSTEYESSVPDKFNLSQNYPNPFNPTTKIKFTILSAGTYRNTPVKLIIYDVLGNEIATLVNEEKPPGVYEVIFNVKDLINQFPTSGIYFYQLRTSFKIQTKKMILLK